MSCIAGCFSARRSFDTTAPRRMLAVMHARAPDGDQFHSDDGVALGQAFLRTGSSGAEAINALTLDGEVWLVADARIDGRPELLRALRACGRAVKDDAPHAELILHAYAAFGDDLVKHLIGDFAFVIWDSRRQRLLCMRDHFGVRPLYHATVNGDFYFASTIDALLAIDGISPELEPQAVAEFLLVGIFTSVDRTIYRSIRCQAPASAIVISGNTRETWQWWQPERSPDVRYRRHEEYIEHFDEIFRQAVVDRLPTGALGLQLSAGMDSTSIAAIAAEALRNAGHAVTAYHQTSQSVIEEDDEQPYAQQVADRLCIPMSSLDLGELPLFEGSLEPRLRCAQPFVMPHLIAHDRTLDHMQEAGARVLFSGYMGDAALASHPTYYTDLLRTGRPVKFAKEVVHHLLLSGSIRGLGLRTIRRHPARSPEWKPDLPDWADSSLLSGSDLVAIWQKVWYLHENSNDGVEQFRLPWINRQFQAIEILPKPVVGRYPFFDIRLLQFLFGAPNYLLKDKRILREAMRRRLPREVVDRPKRGAPGDLVRKLVTNGKISSDFWKPELPPFVNQARFMLAWQRYHDGAGNDSTWASWLMMQTIALGHWLANNGAARKDK